MEIVVDVSSIRGDTHMRAVLKDMQNNGDTHLIGPWNERCRNILPARIVITHDDQKTSVPMKEFERLPVTERWYRYRTPHRIALEISRSDAEGWKIQLGRWVWTTGGRPD